jgi:DNA-directed RNA polymerase specialized sigma24 family protein
MSKRICKGSPESEDVAHYVLSEFIEHKQAIRLIEDNEAMKFLSGMIWRSFNSSTSRYHKIYRQNNRVYTQETPIEREDTEYDYDTDYTIEAIEGILEEMQAESIELWFRATLFKMWLETKNYSEISRKTDIPRTSISQAVEECRQYIKQTLKDRNVNYDI